MIRRAGRAPSSKPHKAKGESIHETCQVSWPLQPPENAKSSGPSWPANPLIRTPIFRLLGRGSSLEQGFGPIWVRSDSKDCGLNPPSGFLPSRLIPGRTVLWLVINHESSGKSTSNESKSNGRLVLAEHGRSRNRAASSPHRTRNPCGVARV